jgi:hypothetical protein
MFWIIFPLSVLVGVLVGWMIGRTRGMPVLGAILGILGPIGWIGLLFIPRPQTATSPAPLAPHGSTTHGRPADLPSEQLPRHPDA